MDFKKQTADFAVNGRLLESLHSNKLRKDKPTCKSCCQELRAFSDCRKYEKPSGNLIADVLLKRCDGEPNCDDASDEADCRFIEKSNSYQHQSTMVNVNVNVNVKTSQEINEIKAAFQVQFWLQMVWLSLI